MFCITHYSRGYRRHPLWLLLHSTITIPLWKRYLFFDLVGSLSGGTIAGIAIGAVAAAVILILVGVGVCVAIVKSNKRGKVALTHHPMLHAETSSPVSVCACVYMCSMCMYVNMPKVCACINVFLRNIETGVLMQVQSLPLLSSGPGDATVESPRPDSSSQLKTEIEQGAYIMHYISL